MKLSVALPSLLVALDGASANRHMNGGSGAARNLVRNARRVQQNNYYNGAYGNQGYYNNQGEQGGDEDASYLAGYSLKMLTCIQGEQSYNSERGETEPSTVVFRLCPYNTCGADNSTNIPCDEGYGDFAVGIKTFAKAYVESIKDNYNGGMQYYSYDYGEFNVEEYLDECRLFEEGENNQNNYYGTYAYIGPACTEDGTDIKLASFSDPYCSTESTDSFESTHNGYSLPYSNGGLVPNSCISCMSYNNNYEGEISEFCTETYQDSNYRCEQNMQYYNQYYGPDTRGCEYLEDKIPAEVRTSSSSTSDGEQSGTKSGNFFTNQPEGLKMAEEYLAMLIVSGLVGAAVVIFIMQKKAAQKKTEKEGLEQSKMPGFVGTIKASAAGLIAKVKGTPKSEGEYKDMDDKSHTTPVIEETPVGKDDGKKSTTQEEAYMI